MIGKTDVIFSCVPLCGRHFVYKGNIITIFHFEGKRPESIVLIMNKAQEVTIIGPHFLEVNMKRCQSLWPCSEINCLITYDMLAH